MAKAKRANILPPLTGEIQCSDCDQPASEYDHRDYFKALDVEPVCSKCNKRRGPAFPFTVEGQNDDPGSERTKNWKWDGLKMRLVEVPYD